MAEGRSKHHNSTSLSGGLRQVCASNSQLQLPSGVEWGRASRVMSLGGMAYVGWDVDAGKVWFIQKYGTSSACLPPSRPSGQFKCCRVFALPNKPPRSPGSRKAAGQASGEPKTSSHPSGRLSSQRFGGDVKKHPQRRTPSRPPGEHHATQYKYQVLQITMYPADSSRCQDPFIHAATAVACLNCHRSKL
jgi:hypothetical protein